MKMELEGKIEKIGVLEEENKELTRKFEEYEK